MQPKISLIHLKQFWGLLNKHKGLWTVKLCFASVTEWGGRASLSNSVKAKGFLPCQESDFNNYQEELETGVPPINFCYRVLLTACLTAMHRWGEESTLESLFFILFFSLHSSQILKAVSRASQKEELISLALSMCATDESSQTSLKNFNVVFCFLVSKSNIFPLFRWFHSESLHC